MSVSTAGAVDFRSDKERIARYTRQTRNAVRAGNEAAAQADWGSNPPPLLPTAAYPPGWYVDEHDPRFIRYWTTAGPTDQIQPIPDPGAVAAPAGPAAIGAAPSIADEIGRLADLHRSGVLSDDEFATAKQRLLG